MEDAKRRGREIDGQTDGRIERERDLERKTSKGVIAPIGFDAMAHANTREQTSKKASVGCTHAAANS